METLAVVFPSPERLELRRLPLPEVGAGQVAVAVEWSGISTGTERLLWTGRMPSFPGMGYPLVPGYESVGRVVQVGEGVDLREGDRVFVPGASCYGDVRGLFGGAASNVVVSASRVTRLPDMSPDEGVLLALAATAQHAIAGGALPQLVVGHGVLGRLLARLVVAAGGEPVVWEKNRARAEGAQGYRVLDPAGDPRRDYATIVDVSGDSTLLDALIARVARGGEIVLAGFYAEPLLFTFPPAFMREVRLRVAAEWQPADLAVVRDHLAAGRLELGGLITHRRDHTEAAGAYETAFSDPSCLKMLLDWRTSR